MTNLEFDPDRPVFVGTLPSGSSDHRSRGVPELAVPVRGRARMNRDPQEPNGAKMRWICKKFDGRRTATTRQRTKGHSKVRSIYIPACNSRRWGSPHVTSRHTGRYEKMRSRHPFQDTPCEKKIANDQLHNTTSCTGKGERKIQRQCSDLKSGVKRTPSWLIQSTLQLSAGGSLGKRGPKSGVFVYLPTMPDSMGHR